MRGKYGMPYYMGLSQVSFFYLSSEHLLIVYVYFVLCMFILYCVWSVVV